MYSIASFVAPKDNLLVSVPAISSLDIPDCEVMSTALTERYGYMPHEGMWVVWKSEWDYTEAEERFTCYLRLYLTDNFDKCIIYFY